jgi:glycosyltransferase involved in cell wall biosynthesis
MLTYYFESLVSLNYSRHMNAISAVIITYNEEANIGRCLDSVRQVADEIIVLDAFSTDNTVMIARSKGATVKQEKFTGYIQQKNKAILYASNDYILSLDADEALDKVLINALLEARKQAPADAWMMSRCTNYCGKFIRRGTWYPDKKIRLFNKQIAKWGGTNPHDKIEITKENSNIQQLKGDILHYSFPTIEDHLRKNDKYSSLSANALYSKKVKSSWYKMLIHPFWAFLHGYIIRGGFLEGFQGLLIAVNSAHATFLKYAKLYHLQHSQPVRNAEYRTIKPRNVKGKEAEVA